MLIRPKLLEQASVNFYSSCCCCFFPRKMRQTLRCDAPVWRSSRWKAAHFADKRNCSPIDMQINGSSDRVWRDQSKTIDMIIRAVTVINGGRLQGEKRNTPRQKFQFAFDADTYRSRPNQSDCLTDETLNDQWVSDCLRWQVTDQHTLNVNHRCLLPSTARQNVYWSNHVLSSSASSVKQ